MGWNKTPTEHKSFPEHLPLFWDLPQNSSHLPLIYIGFTLGLHWFQKPVKHAGFRTAEGHSTNHSKTIPLAGKPEMSAASNTNHGNFSILQGQKNFKIPIMARRWQLEPFRHGVGSAPSPGLPWLQMSAWYGKPELPSNRHWSLWIQGNNEPLRLVEAHTQNPL